MNYNEKENKKMSVRTILIDKTEWIKGENGKEFNVNVITYKKHRPRINLEDVMVTLDKIIDRLILIDGRIDSLERRMDSLEKRMDSLEQRMNSLEQRMDSLEQRIDALENKLNRVIDLNHLKS